MFTASDQSFIILQNTLLTGITSISFDQQTNEEAVNLIATQGITRRIVNPTITNCKISKKYFGEDIFRSFTGFVGLSGQFIYGSDALDFDDAVISNYSISMDTQGIPTMSIDLKIYGDLKPATNIRKSNAVPDHTIRELDVNSVSFNFMEKTVPITNFTFGAAFKVKPSYEIASIKSSTVKIIPPVQLSSSVKMEMTEQEFENISGLVKSLPNTGQDQRNRRFSLSFHDSKIVDKMLSESGRFFGYTSAGLNTGLYPTATTSLQNTGIAKFKPYDFSGFSLNSQSVSISTNETIQLEAKYGGYLFNLPSGPAPSAPRTLAKTRFYSNDFEHIPLGGVAADQDSQSQNNAQALPILTDDLGKLSVFGVMDGTGTIKITSGSFATGLKSLTLEEPTGEFFGIRFSGFTETGEFMVSGMYSSVNTGSLIVLASNDGSHSIAPEIHHALIGNMTFQQFYSVNSGGRFFETNPFSIISTAGYVDVSVFGTHINKAQSVNINSLVVEKINTTDTDIAATTGRVFTAVNDAIQNFLTGGAGEGGNN